MTEVLLPLGDDRRLQVFLSGSADDPLLFFNQGTSGHGPELPLVVQPALAAGFQVAEIVRPGYMSSTPQPGRRVCDAQEWVAAVLEYTGAQEFWVAGHSGGGPTTLATAHYFPEQCRGALTLAGVAPSDEPGLDFTAGMQQLTVDYLAPADPSETTFRGIADNWSTMLMDMSLEEFVADDPDDPEAWLNEPYGEMIYHGMRRALSGGTEGVVADLVAFHQPWGFDVRDIRVPTTVVGGVLDYAVPIGHARWLSANIPGATLREYPDDGHSAVLCSGYPTVLEEWRAQRA